MKFLRQRDNLGFTLIELMVVVSIIGVITSVAIPSFIRYIKQTKTSEISLQLKTLGDSAAQYYQVDHYDEAGVPRPEQMFPSSTGDVTDTTETVVPSFVPVGGKYFSTVADWRVTPWKDMKFKISKAQYFQYGYRSDNTNAQRNFTAVARGDLDSDTITSLYQVRGFGDDDLITLTPLIVDLDNALE